MEQKGPKGTTEEQCRSLTPGAINLRNAAMETLVQGRKNDAEQPAKSEWTKPEITRLGVPSTQTGGGGYAAEYIANHCPANVYSRHTNVCAS